MQNTMLSPHDIYHIPVRLGHLRHLYEAPDFNPFASSSEHLSGIDRISTEVRRNQPKGIVRATIYLPVDIFSADLEPVCSAALIIAGSVGLWYPVELVLYEWWEQYGEKKLYTHIKNIEIQVACMEEPLS